MVGEGPHHTLQATALVNDAYLRLVDAQAVTHFTDGMYAFVKVSQ
jgi:hypothetical protein